MDAKVEDGEMWSLLWGERRREAVPHPGSSWGLVLQTWPQVLQRIRIVIHVIPARKIGLWSCKDFIWFLQGNNGETHLGRSILGELPLTGRGQHPALSINVRLHAYERFYKNGQNCICFSLIHLSVSTAQHGMTFWLNCPPGRFYNLCPVTALAYQTNNKTLSQGQDWSACHAFTKGFVLLLDYWYSVSCSQLGLLEKQLTE